MTTRQVDGDEYLNGELGIGQSSPAAMLDILQPTLGSVIQRLSSVSSGDHPIEDVLQFRIATVNATLTNLIVLPTVSGFSYGFHMFTSAKRTGGASGSAGDDFWGINYGIIRNIGGTITGTNTSLGSGGALATTGAIVNTTITNSGANALIRAAGLASYNISWVSTIRIYPLSA